MNPRAWRRSVATLLTLAVLLASAPAVLADGEIGDIGDTDSITDLYTDGNGRVTSRIDYPNDARPGSAAASR